MSKLTTAQARDTINDAVGTFMDSQVFTNWLRARTHLHTYSLGNQAWLFAQDDNVSIVAGFHAWKKLGRRVMKGGRGLKVLAPNVYKDADTDEKVVRGFHVTYVFDISQTEGEALPELPADRLARLADKQIDDTLIAFGQSQGITVYTDTAACKELGALGFYRPGKGRKRPELVLSGDAFGAIFQHTLIHELMHHFVLTESERMKKLPRDLHEVLAETGALLVMTALGYEVDPASVAYIARHAHDKEVFFNLLDVADRFTKPIIAALTDATQNLPPVPVDAEEDLVA